MILSEAQRIRWITSSGNVSLKVQMEDHACASMIRFITSLCVPEVQSYHPTWFICRRTQHVPQGSKTFTRTLSTLFVYNEN